VDTVTTPDARPVQAAEQISELALLERVVAGDEDAFEALYVRYQPKLLSFLKRMLGDPSAAEEVADDVLVVLWQSAHRFEGRSKLSTWLFGIAYRKAANVLRSRLYRKEIPLDDSLSDAAPDAARRVELGEWLDKAFGELSADHRMVVELTFVHGLSYQEIAAIADCPVNTVKTRMFHARRRLQAALNALDSSRAEDL
jgi:RNA polymerase sigma factor (sigma-70 family)